jgi:glycosyltransferase involved in cell wall biosynthesis
LDKGIKSDIYSIYKLQLQKVMKVLFIHCHYKLAGGEDGVVAAEIELLRSNGIEVELMAFSNEGSSLLKILQLPFNIKAYLKTKQHVKKVRPDIVHIHNLHFAASASVLYALRSEKIPFVITLHNFRLLCPSGTLYHNGNPYIKSLNTAFPWAAVKDGIYNNSKLLTFWVGFSTWINRLIGTWKMADRYIVLTGHAKDVISKSNLHLKQGKVVIKPNFVYSTPEVSGYRDSKFLFVGRLSEEKGIRTLIDAFAHSPYRLTIIGDGPLKDIVEAAVAVNSNITYIGYQKKDVISKELRKSSALIFPSVWYETFGLTIIEAFATSTPVIASNIGSASLLIKDGFNGLHFEQSNVAALKARLQQWMALSDQQITAFQQNARLTYEKYYTPEENFEQLMNIYTSVIDEKKGITKPANKYSKV